MKTVLSVEDPDAIEMTMRITMPLKSWRELKDQMPTEWPAMGLREKITDMVIKAERHFYGSEP